MDYLRQFTAKIEIAGSVRRRSPTVKDVELLAVPLIDEEDRPGDLFNQVLKYPVNLLDKALDELLARGVLEKRPNKDGRFIYGPKNKLLVHTRSRIPIDIFSTPLEQWGMALLVRTGPYDFNIRVMGTLKKRGMAGHAYGGITDQDGREIDCPTEDVVFDMLGWRFVPPEARSSPPRRPQGNTPRSYRGS